ncbi:GNAT family N-acetyltransferase [Paraburkholderia acidipaludis]|uniref:GNAT family N-acetyltransferase n=1 Tax=Paraburkholderia acidipaludis TaxID=660537 RepID=UPI0005BE7478|nr:GNAT family N-acetyltransferase [Paraburkholderia acidipaludis]
MRLKAPEPLTAQHEVSAFDSLEPSLNDWLRRRALKNQQSGATRTYVVCDASRVIGYYALASGSVSSVDATGRIRRNMPDPVPVVILARIAVDRDWQGQGIASDMMRDAALRVLQAADIIGVRGMLAHALTERARQFYMKLAFEVSPLDPMTLMIGLTDLRATLL